MVLTGEGSDEIFLGYDLYRETRVRQFWARRPGSRWRPALLRRLYPYLPMSRQGQELLQQFFAIGLDDPSGPGFSHLPRWAASGHTLRFLSRGFAESAAEEDPVASVLASLPARVRGWKPLARAQYLEMQTLLGGYLLGAQGDRMLLSREAVRKAGVFNEEKVEKLMAKLSTRSGAASEVDSQALTAVATTQLLVDQLLPPRPVPQREVDAVELETA